MNKLKDTDIVYIDPINGWHYHMKECWMAGTKPITVAEMRKLKTALGGSFVSCACVEAYQLGKHIVSKPTLGVRNE
jgi:hypothetical protein